MGVFSLDFRFAPWLVSPLAAALPLVEVAVAPFATAPSSTCISIAFAFGSRSPVAAAADAAVAVRAPRVDVSYSSILVTLTQDC